jgi:hypothetical protein
MQRLSNPRRTGGFMQHRKYFAENIDLASAGLEIGAFDLPFVEPGEGNCEFADFRSMDELQTMAAAIEGHNPEFVVPVSYDLRKGYSEISKQFDWIVASHVIEHVPDLIWWLNILASKLKPNGTVFFVVPDKRYIWDVHRHVTTLTDVVEAHRAGQQTPSFRQVFDHYYLQAPMLDPGQLWSGVQPGPPMRNYAIAAERAHSALVRHEDAHCSVFTPESFAQLMSDLTNAGLITLRLSNIRPTMLNQMDFDVIMRF